MKIIFKPFIFYGLGLFLLLSLCLGLAACKPTSTTTSSTTSSTSTSQTSTSVATSTPTPTLSFITISPASPPTLKVGSSIQFRAIGTYSDGSTKDVSDQVLWASNYPEIATIDPTGIVTGVEDGTTVIAASYYPGITSQKVFLTVA